MKYLFDEESKNQLIHDIKMMTLCYGALCVIAGMIMGWSLHAIMVP